jgi:hypothetical protein
MHGIHYVESWNAKTYPKRGVTIRTTGLYINEFSSCSFFFAREESGEFMKLGHFEAGEEAFGV